MGRLLIAMGLMLFSLSTHADERLFYQPQNADASLDAAQWREIWQQSVANGVHTLIVQWTRYGDEDFGGADGWLAQALREAENQGLGLILGLSYDPAYYRHLPDNSRFATYWYRQLSRALAQQQRLAEWRLDPVGWYLPLELDDRLFRDAATRDELQRQLETFTARLERPLHVSVFSGGFLAPQVFADWLATLAQSGIRVWWQDGRGTAALDSPVRQAYEDALGCRIGIVREAFRQTSRPPAPFEAEPMPPHAAPACHASAVFSLRYRPWAQAFHERLQVLPGETTAPQSP